MQQNDTDVNRNAAPKLPIVNRKMEQQTWALTLCVDFGEGLCARQCQGKSNVWHLVQSTAVIWKGASPSYLSQDGIIWVASHGSHPGKRRVPGSVITTC